MNREWHRTDFTFHLPDDQIAQAPPTVRGDSRLMVLDPGRSSRTGSLVRELDRWVEPGTLMVFNDTRVRKARLFGLTERGGRVELVLLRPLADGTWECLLSRSKRLRQGQLLQMETGVVATIKTGVGNVRPVSFDPPIDDDWISRHGHLPLPPYIHRPDSEEDEARYQTIYAREPGSAAAPTAGLHFTQELLDRLAGRGIETAFVTLEVGLGTFLPVRAEKVSDHVMHRERFQISQHAADRINSARREHRPILAVGTTSLRTLEAAWTPDGFQAGWDSTDLFITPGYQFRAVDQLFTNFHTPESTLLMLVCAFAGREFLLDSYRDAVSQGYRFFSYGDAMLIRSQGMTEV